MSAPIPKPGILDIAPYVPGRAKLAGVERPLKLSANENPFGCSEAARAAFLTGSSELALYPDANTSRLRAAIAEKVNLEPERLVFGAGSDEIFAMAAQAYLGPGENAVQPQFGFAAWAIAVAATGARMVSVHEPDYVTDIDAMLAAIDDQTRIVFIANPANPTGAWLPFSEVERLHASMPTRVLLVLDGAYAECAYDIDGFSDGMEWARNKSNVLVTRTFSKVYGLASLRIGWAYGPAPVVAALDRIRLPFSVSRAGEAAAIAALADDAFVQRSVEAFKQGREALADALQAKGVRTLPSATNFVTAYFGDAKPIEAQFAQRGIIVRNLANYGMPNWLRISIGAPAEMERVVEALSTFSPV